MSSIHDALRRARQNQGASTGKTTLVQHRDLLGVRKQSRWPAVLAVAVILVLAGGTYLALGTNALKNLTNKDAQLTAEKSKPAKAAPVRQKKADTPIRPAKKEVVTANVKLKPRARPALAQTKPKNTAAPENVIEPKTVIAEVTVKSKAKAIVEKKAPILLAAKKDTSKKVISRPEIKDKQKKQLALKRKPALKSKTPAVDKTKIRPPVKTKPSSQPAAKAADTRKAATKKLPVVPKPIVKPAVKKEIKTALKTVVKPPAVKKSAVMGTAVEHFKAALTAQKKGRYDEAVAGYRRAISINPEYLDAFINLGNIFLSQKNSVDKALDVYKKILKIDPGNKFGHNNLGVLYLKRNLLGQAESEFEAALEIDSGFVDALYNLACLNAKKGVESRALAYLARAIGIDPEVKIWAREDSDLQSLRNSREFNKLIDPIVSN